MMKLIRLLYNEKESFAIILKLRSAGIQCIQDVKRAVLEQNEQLTIVQNGEKIPSWDFFMYF